MSRPLHELAQLSREMRRRPSLEDLLQLITERAAVLLGVSRVSVRLLEPGGARLLAVARAGQPIHAQPVAFRLGEGLIGWIAQEGEVVLVPDAEADPRFAARPGRTERIGAFLGVPMMAGATCMGVISAVSPDAAFTEAQLDLLVLLAELSAPYVEISRLSRLSQVDPLTGSLNRRGLDESFPEIVATEDGLITPLSVAMMDLDHFKHVNDERGHAVGDLVLKHVTNVVSQVLRAGDAVVRVGGEEFLLILPSVDRAAAERVAERCRAAIESLPTPLAGEPVHVTASFGVAQRKVDEQRDALIARADHALYEAKRAGRNRVCSSR